METSLLHQGLLGGKHNQSQSLKESLSFWVCSHWLYGQGQRWQQLQVAQFRQDPVLEKLLVQPLRVEDVCVQVLLRSRSESSSTQALCCDLGGLLLRLWCFCLHPALCLPAPSKHRWLPSPCVCGGAFWVSRGLNGREESLFGADPCGSCVWGCRISILECRGDVLIHAAQGEPTLHLKAGQGGGVKQGFFFFPFLFVFDVLHSWLLQVTP